MFVLDLRSRVPIYEQITQKFTELIIKDVLKPDEQLPPVRLLANQLTVNPNTIQKAYRELEHMGYIYSVPGKGHFVISAASALQNERRKELQQQLRQIILELKELGLDREDIVYLIESEPPDKGGKETT
jgi:GntR family transcriptional regulator